MIMFYTTKQKFILGTLKKLGCIRQRQLHALMRGHFREEDFEITRASMMAMLRQLRVGTANLRMDDELVWLSNQQPDSRRLGAIDVMIELTGGGPQGFEGKMAPPRLLRFSYGQDSLRLFTVVSLEVSSPELLERSPKERVVWISDSGEAPQGLVLPPKHFFAARQPDGTHRFYGSNGP